LPPETRNRPRTPFAPQLDLPPPYTLVALREVGDAFAHAVGLAPAQGAGTLVYVGRFDLAEFAVVLEPEDFYLLLSAEAIRISSHVPQLMLKAGCPRLFR